VSGGAAGLCGSKITNPKNVMKNVKEANFGNYLAWFSSPEKEH
jgi:hypothetical protein